MSGRAPPTPILSPERDAQAPEDKHTEAEQRLDGSRDAMVEQELRQTTQLLDSIVESLPLMVFLKDAKTLRYLRINQTGASILGCAPDQMLGKTDFECFTPEQAQLCRDSDLAALQGSVGVQVERERISTPRGECILRTKKIPLFDEQGEPAYVLGVGEDITRRQQVEEDLQEISDLLRIGGHMAKLGGWRYDLATEQLVWSDEVARIHEVSFGYSPNLHASFDFVSEPHRARLRARFDECLRSGSRYDEEVELVTARGRRVWIRNIGEALRDQSGSIVRVHGAIQDVSEYKSAEEERRKLSQQLMAAHKMDSIGRLAGGVAHDFNNMLSVVLGYVGFALEATREGDPLREDLEEVKKAGERAATLTRQLLAFSRKQIMAPEQLDTNKVLTGIQPMLRRLLGEDIESELSLTEQLGLVRADPAQLEQVILNLVINAREAMPDGGKLRIETRNVDVDAAFAAQQLGVSAGSYVVLSVRDDGRGMTEATREQLFEPFFSTKENVRGSGLGLSIVHGVVSQSGGFLTVDSELGKGSEFCVYLPRVSPTQPALRRSPVAATANELILIVEDEEAVRRIAERILKSAGYRVRTAANGGEALLLCETMEQRFDLLLTDVVMPKMSGPDLVQRLLALAPDIKTLYMSGYPDNAAVQNTLMQTGTPLVAKPFSADELTRKVREVLDSGRPGKP